MYDILFYIFSIINLLALKNIYWPILKDHIIGLIELESILKSWQMVFAAYFSLLIILLKQWLLKTAESIDGNKYLITHVLDGKVVKFVIKPSVKKLTAVVDENYEECYFEESEPFFKYEIENFNPKIIGLKKSLLIHFNDSKIIHVFPTNDSPIDVEENVEENVEEKNNKIFIKSKL